MNIGDTSMEEHKNEGLGKSFLLSIAAHYLTKIHATAKDQCCGKVTGLHNSKIANKLDPRVDSDQPATAQRTSGTRMPGWMVA